MDDNQSSDDSLQATEQVTEGEVVESSGTPSETTSSQGQVMVLESLESMIRENLGKISALQKELNQQKEMIDSVLGNDPTYKQHDDAVKAATKVKTATKQEILKRPDVAHVDAKVKSLSAEIKEAKESLNSYLPEYQRLSGSSEINDENGEPMQIVFQARLVKMRS